MTSRIIWGSITGALVCLLACTASSSNGNGSNGGAAGSCAQTLSGSSGSACGSCEQTNCGSEISGVESGCGDLLSCVCPGGTYNASLLQGCASKAQESSCTSASQAMGSCVSAHCANECGGGTSSGGGSDSGGASSGGSSSGGTSGAAYCSVSSANTCYVFKNGPPETPGGNAVKCSAELQGSAASSCPSAGLLGCCIYSSPSDYECFYTGSGATGCSGGTGVGNWSTTTVP